MNKKSSIVRVNNADLIWRFVMFIPIILFVGLTPLMVHLKTVEMNHLIEAWLPTPFIYNDVFNYYKAEMIFISALLAIVIWMYGWIIGKTDLGGMILKIKKC